MSSCEFKFILSVKMVKIYLNKMLKIFNKVILLKNVYNV